MVHLATTTAWAFSRRCRRGKAQWCTKLGWTLSTDAAIDTHKFLPPYPRGFRSQTRNKRTQGLNKSSLLLKFNTLNQICS